MRKIGQRLALLNALAEDAVKPLSRAFDQSAFAKGLGDTAIARILLPKNIVGCDTGWKATGTDNLDAPRVLSNEDRPTVTVISMTHRIQNSLAHHTLIESGHIPHKETLLERLSVITQVDKSPDFVKHQEKSLPKLMSFRCWPRYFIGSVLEDDLRLCEIFAPGLPACQAGSAQRTLPDHRQPTRHLTRAALWDGPIYPGPAT